VREPQPGGGTVERGASHEVLFGTGRGTPPQGRCAPFERVHHQAMRFDALSFGHIEIDGVSYDHDVVIDRGRIRKRKKKPSKRYRDAFGHTPLSLEEDIPWKCRTLVIGTGTGALPVMKEVRREAKRRGVDLVVEPTREAIEALKRASDANAVLHVTC
jgi:hypothetical protein